MLSIRRKMTVDSNHPIGLLKREGMNTTPAPKPKRWGLPAILPLQASRQLWMLLAKRLRQQSGAQGLQAHQKAMSRGNG